MIEINLLPGARKAKGGGVARMDVGDLVRRGLGQVRDPYLAIGIAAFVLGAAIMGVMYFRQSAREGTVVERERKAVQDSTRYATVLRERARAEANRDSVLRQLRIIQVLDGERYVWSHVLDEMSEALPPYTWLMRIRQTSPIVSLASREAYAVPSDSAKVTGPIGAARAAAGRANGALTDEEGNPEAGTARGAAPAGGGRGRGAASRDSVAPPPRIGPLTFHATGETVDIAALTRYMRLLEASPFLRDVKLVSTALVKTVDNKEVTRFELEIMFEQPDSSAIRTVPLTISVR
jgi:Tfp pilus assembly protein PilN